MAAERSLSYREVLQNEDVPLRWKEITVATGSTDDLEEGKSTEISGGYAYCESGHANSPLRNRALYWRSSGEVIEVVEWSLDVRLTDRRVRFRFGSAVVAVNIAEGVGHVVLLVATRGSVHRLVFKHPQHKQSYTTLFEQPSILASASSVQLPANVCQLSTGSSRGGQPAVTIATATQAASGNAVFVLANGGTKLLVVTLPPFGANGVPIQFELCQSSMMQRLWSGFIPTSIKGGENSLESCVSLSIHSFQHDAVILALGRDTKLRLWSLKTQECVHIINMLDYVAGDVDVQTFVTCSNSGSHVVKKSDRSGSSAVMVAIYLSLGERSQFSVFGMCYENSHYTFNHLSTVFTFPETLVDFCITASHLWSLWSNSDMETFVRSAPIYGVDSATPCRWLSVHCSPAEPPDITVPPHLEPRETYMRAIFEPGRFTSTAIVKALNIYRRSLDASHMADFCVPVQALKMEVSAVLEHEIQNAASEYEMDEEEYVQLQLQQWSKFYSCCVQYQQRCTKPLGIFACVGSRLTMVVKKNCMSILRQCSSMEHFYLSAPEQISAVGGDITSVLSTDSALAADLSRVYECLRLIAGCLSDEMAYCVQQDLYHAQNPRQVACSIVENIVLNSKLTVLSEVELRIRSMTNVYDAIKFLLQQLDLVGTETANENEVPVMASESPTTGMAILSSMAHQIAETRLCVARDLLLLLTMMAKISDKTSKDICEAHMIQADMVGRASTMLQACYILKWSTDTLCSAARASVIDSNIRQLDALNITDGSVAPFITDKSGERDAHLMSLFVCSEACRHITSRHLTVDAPVGSQLVPSVVDLLRLVWPMNMSFDFPEWLLRRCQYEHVQDYVRLTRQWCECNVSSARFILAQSYLNTGESDKAMECFLKAVHGITTEHFLARLLQNESGDEKHAEVIYFLKVIRLFEQFDLPHLVISLARTAISIAENDDPYVPTLWSKIFKYHLEVGHNEEAYTALICNPDASRRKDCLRQFLVVLCERSQLQTIVELPYKDRHVNLEEEVVNILASRARSIDLTKHTYYDLLYSFHVFRGNFRKAGSVMYEFGMRIGQEVGGLRGLQKQAKCYLATLNALRLVDSKYAWIVKPVPSTKQKQELPSMSPKHTLDGEERIVTPKRRVELLVLDDIEREYLLVHARLQLLQKDHDPARITGATPSATETVALMVDAGLLDSAINICRLFSLPLTPIFQGLAARCVSLAQNSDIHMASENQYTTSAWNWLQYNDLSTDTNSSADVSLCDQAWRLLQRYLQRYECKGSSRYHRAITLKLLAHAFHLPDWLIASYKMCNPAELLRLYLDYDLLAEAAYLTIEYIDGVLGRGKEYFGLQTYLHCGAPAVWLPYACIDQLLAALDKVETDKFYTQLHSDVMAKLKVYLQSVVSVSGDTLAAAHSRVTKKSGPSVKSFHMSEHILVTNNEYCPQ